MYNLCAASPRYCGALPARRLHNISSSLHTHTHTRRPRGTAPSHSHTPHPPFKILLRLGSITFHPQSPNSETLRAAPTDQAARASRYLTHPPSMARGHSLATPCIGCRSSGAEEGTGTNPTCASPVENPIMKPPVQSHRVPPVVTSLRGDLAGGGDTKGLRFSTLI